MFIRIIIPLMSGNGSSQIFSVAACTLYTVPYTEHCTLHTALRSLLHIIGFEKRLKKTEETYHISRMSLSILQMGKQRTRDRNLVINRLDAKLSLVSVSISYDGGVKFEGVSTFGISATDSTQHSIFAFEIDLLKECSFDPCKIGAVAISKLARDNLKIQGIELNPENCEVFLVTHLQKNIAKTGAAHPKYRVTFIPINSGTDFTPGQSLEQPETFRRMSNFFSERLWK